MKLNELKPLLSQNPLATVGFILPTDSKIPPHAHVTEVALVEKKFVDCGGTFRSESVCRLQVWFAADTDHRLTCGKLLAILEKSSSFLSSDALEVDIEYEAPFISQFPVERINATPAELSIRLGIKHTACLAEDRCIPPNLNKPSLLTPLPDFTPRKCC